MRIIVGCPVQSQFGVRPPLSAAGLLLTIRTAARRPTDCIVGVLVGVLGVLFGVLGVLVGILGFLVGVIDAFGIVMLY